MIKTIWNFFLELKDKQTIELPKDAEILSLQNQMGIPCISALINPDAPKEELLIEMFGIGDEINYDMGVNRKHLGTVQLAGGDLVYHVFLRIN